MLEDDVVDDNVMGKFHVDARYTKRTSEAAYQFIRTDDVPESNHIYGTGALSVRVSFGESIHIFCPSSDIGVYQLSNWWEVVAMKTHGTILT